MKIHNFKRIDRGTLIAKLELEFEEWGLTIRDCMILKGKNGMWVSYPSRQYEQDGQKKYFHLVVFTKEKQDQINNHVLERLKNELKPENNSTGDSFYATSAKVPFDQTSTGAPF